MTQTLLVAHTPNVTAVIQEGTPPTNLPAWFIDIPDGSDALTAAAAWVKTQTFPIGTIMYVFDPATAQKFELQANWSPMT